MSAVSEENYLLLCLMLGFVFGGAALLAWLSDWFEKHWPTK